MSEDQNVILMAIQGIVDSPSTFDHERFILIARRDLQYAFTQLEQAKFHLMPLVQNHENIALAMFAVDWEYLGPKKFLEHHVLQIGLNQATPESRFVLSRLQECVDDFDNADLWDLRKMLFLAPDLRTTVIDVMSHRVVTFAQRISAAPLEISADVDSLKKSIRDYGFSAAMNEVLEEVDKELAKPASAFDQVGTMQHIRSFFEKLHQHIGEELQRRKPSTANKTPLNKCGQAIEFLRQKNVITEKLQALAKSLYGILSDSDFGCHAIKATRDYTRLCRNMVVEYAVALFFELERRLAEP